MILANRDDPERFWATEWATLAISPTKKIARFRLEISWCACRESNSDLGFRRNTSLTT
jgi:hypothetical protein